MASISLCMIVKNEEEVLGRCLDSIRQSVDEIIIVDTGSTDRTVCEAEKYTDKIYHFEWRDDFSAARNYALERGSCDYLMWMDADDVLPEGEAGRLKELKNSLDGDTDFVMLPYAAAFHDDGSPSFLYYRERIIRNGKGHLFKGRVHEAIPVKGKLVYSDIRIEHRKTGRSDGNRNLRIYEEMEKNKEKFDGRSLYYYGRELVSHKSYEKAVLMLEKFMDSPDGWKENKIDATRELAVCYYRIGKPDHALKSLLRALEFDVPRGETCCSLGYHFMDRGRYEEAAYWFRQALAAKKADHEGAFIIEDCYGFIPAISLCVCYDRMGDRKTAEKYNELAGNYRPDSPHYLSNKDYFRIY